MPKYLPAGLTQYVLNIFSKKSPPYHVTQDDVSTPLHRLEVEQITVHKSVRRRGGVIPVLYKTHWAGLSEPSWEREMDLHLSCPPHLAILGGNPGPAPPNQPPLPPNRKSRGKNMYAVRLQQQQQQQKKQQMSAWYLNPK